MLSNLFAKNKTRIYITLNHRMELPGYHWGIVAEPKDSHDQGDSNDTVLWEINNVYAKDGKVTVGPWRYSRKTTSPARSFTLIARILLAKVSDQTKVIEKMDDLFSNEPIMENDTCIIWALRCIQKIDNGLIDIGIGLPDLQTKAVEFADEIMQKIQRSEVDIMKPGDIPILDVRKDNR